jgi:hypothetical protein
MSAPALSDERLAAFTTVLDMFAAAKRDDPMGQEAGFTDLLWSAANAAPLLADEVCRLRVELARVQQDLGVMSNRHAVALDHIRQPSAGASPMPGAPMPFPLPQRRRLSFDGCGTEHTYRDCCEYAAAMPDPTVQADRTDTQDGAPC